MFDIILILGTVGIIAVVAGIVGFKWVTSRDLDPKIIKKRLNQADEYIEELEHDIKHYKGKLNQLKQTPTVSADLSDLDDADSIKAVIAEILPKVSPMLPKPLQALAHDPKAIDFAIELYKKDPERAKSLLSGFIKKGKKSESSSGQSMDEPNVIPNFGEGGVL